jgi:hypothetical protein
VGNEIRRLLVALVITPLTCIDHVMHWSRWRRRVEVQAEDRGQPLQAASEGRPVDAEGGGRRVPAALGLYPGHSAGDQGLLLGVPVQGREQRTGELAGCRAGAVRPDQRPRSRHADETS